MTVGAATEHVEVHSDAIALQTEDVSFKQTVDEQDITEMPLNSDSRQITGLLNISGGTNSAPGGDFTGSKYTYQTISVSIAGGNGNTTSWRLDGGTNNDYMANGNLPVPFPDAVGQFSVESTVLGAQQGMHSGGLVNVVTRSGHFTGRHLSSSATTIWMRLTSSRRQRTGCTRTSSEARLAVPFAETSCLRLRVISG
jgi:hypothetical protein